MHTDCNCCNPLPRPLPAPTQSVYGNSESVDEELVDLIYTPSCDEGALDAFVRQGAPPARQAVGEAWAALPLGSLLRLLALAFCSAHRT